MAASVPSSVHAEPAPIRKALERHLMDNWLTTPMYLGALRAEEPVALAATAARMPASLANWLARLRLLYGVPFNYLVPDSRLLPMESVRFFYIDRNFTDRLVDGALSVGKTTTREYAQAQATHGALRVRVDEEERVLRPQLRKNDQVKRIIAPQTADLTGVLLRSRAVSGWPGMEVKAYRDISSAQPQGRRLDLLRMDRLAPDVMLCIFEGVPTRVDVEEPREGIQFGVDLQDTDGNGAVEPSTAVPSGFRLKLRKLTGPLTGQLTHATATRLDPTPQTLAVPVRRSNRRVLHMRLLRERLQQALASSGDPDASPGTLGSGELALQMFQFPFQQRFEGTGNSGYAVTSQYIDTILQVAVIAKPLQVDEVKQLFQLGG
jgi:hypothetical protein